MKKLFLAFNLFLVFVLIDSLHVFGYGFGFVKSKDNIPPSIGSYADIIAGTNSYYIGDTTKKQLYLTFDAGYDNGNLTKILDVLKQKNVNATFFVTGDFVNREQELLKRIADDNHLVGNHTYSHKNITKLSLEELKTETTKLEDAYTKVTGKTMAPFFRPPEGEFDKQSLINVSKLGYRTIFWSIAYRDWDTKKQQGSVYAFNELTKQLHNGAIILLHSVSSDNALVLGKFIDEANRQGYQFTPLSQFPFQD